MDSRSSTFAPALHSTDRRALFVYGLWLRVVFVGMSLLAAGVAHLLAGPASPMPVLASLIGGGALTAFAWRRAGAALGRIDVAEATTGRSVSNDERPAGHRGTDSAPEPSIGRPATAGVLE